MDSDASIDAPKRLFHSIKHYFWIQYFQIFDRDLLYIDRDAASVGSGQDAEIIDAFIDKTKRFFKTDEPIEFLIDYFNNIEFSKMQKSSSDYFLNYCRVERIEDTDIDVLLYKDQASRQFLKLVLEVADYLLIDLNQVPCIEFYETMKEIVKNDVLYTNDAETIFLLNPSNNDLFRNRIVSDQSFLTKFIYYYRHTPKSRLLMIRLLDEFFPDEGQRIRLIRSNKYAALYLCTKYCRQRSRNPDERNAISVSVKFLREVISFGVTDEQEYETYAELYTMRGIGIFADVLAIGDKTIMEIFFANDFANETASRMMTTEEQLNIYNNFAASPTTLMLKLDHYTKIKDIKTLVLAAASTRDIEVFEYFLQDPRLGYNDHNSYLPRLLIRMNAKQKLKALIRNVREASFFLEMFTLEYTPMELNISFTMWNIARKRPDDLTLFLTALREEDMLDPQELTQVKQDIQNDILIDAAIRQGALEILELFSF